jgi:hypothetical protein
MVSSILKTSSLKWRKMRDSKLEKQVVYTNLELVFEAFNAQV